MAVPAEVLGNTVIERPLAVHTPFSFVIAMARCRASAQTWIVCSAVGCALLATWCGSSLGGICGVLQNGL